MKKQYLGCIFFGLLSGNALAISEPVQVLSDATCAGFEVRLPGNPTTGFQWTLRAYDTKHFKLVKSVYVPSSTTRVGAPGERVFYFKQKDKTVCPDSTKLCFRHARQFEPATQRCTTVQVYFSKN